MLLNVETSPIPNPCLYSPWELPPSPIHGAVAAVTSPIPNPCVGTTMTSPVPNPCGGSRHYFPRPNPCDGNRHDIPIHQSMCLYSPWDNFPSRPQSMCRHSPWDDVPRPLPVCGYSLLDFSCEWIPVPKKGLSFRIVFCSFNLWWVTKIFLIPVISLLAFMSHTQPLSTSHICQRLSLKIGAEFAISICTEEGMLNATETIVYNLKFICALNAYSPFIFIAQLSLC